MPLVVDASVLSEYLVGSPSAPQAAGLTSEHGDDLHLPHLAIVETVSALRGWVRGGRLPERRAAQALEDLADFPAHRWPAEPLLPRIWELRDNLTAYDATYVALAESLDATLLTADVRLARRAQGRARCPVTLIWTASLLPLGGEEG